MSETNKVTSAVQKAIDAVDEEINRLYDDIAELRKVKQALKYSGKYISKRVQDHYTVASRSGGSPHHVGRYEDGTWDCNCEASKHDRECWALKGLADLNPCGGAGAGWFYDEKYIRRDYTWSRVEWPAPFRKIRF